MNTTRTQKNREGTETKSIGYSEKDMKLLRRLKLALSFLLAVLLVGGSAVPSSALWQCRYSSRIVSDAFVAPPSAMPCLADSSALRGTMSSMPCCHTVRSASHRNSRGKEAFSPAACHPTLTRLAADPAPGMTDAGSALRRSLAATQSVLPATAAFAVSAPRMLPLRQRPPPTVNSPPTAPAYSFGLRAPPIA